MNPRASFIGHPSALSDLVGRIDEAAAEVAIDCEADSFHHYEEKLCLLQLTFATGGEPADFVIDPLAAGIDLRPLLQVLGRKRLFLHAGDNDLRMLGLRWEFSATEIFDTLIAAQYLGESELGLSALLERHFGVVLDKSLQRADWARRPLTAAMIEYAARDTHYLAELVAILEARLRETGRFEWHRQACARLAGSRPQQKPEDPESWRVKGSSDLDDSERAILRTVWRWREDEARARDQAPFRVAGNDVLLRLARVARQSGSAADALTAARIRASGASLRALGAALEMGLSMPEEQWPGPPPRNRPTRLSGAQEARFEKLRTARDQVAGKLAIDPGLLASRSALERISALAAPSTDELISTGGLLPWQAEMLTGG